jgi:hypothetical protein
MLNDMNRAKHAHGQAPQQMLIADQMMQPAQTEYVAKGVNRVCVCVCVSGRGGPMDRRRERIVKWIDGGTLTN